MSAVILRSEIIHYEVLGRGRPVFFIHDWVGSWRYWIASMQASSISYRTYAIDLWGFGDTAKNPSYYSLEQQTTLLEEFTDELGIGKIAVVGHGLGAIVGLLYTIRHPDLVDRVMAISFPNSEVGVNARLRSARPVELVDWLLARSPSTESVWTEASKTDPGAITTSIANLQNIDLPRLSNQLTAPLLFVYGANDPAISAPDLGSLTSGRENTHTILFDQSSHFPMLEETSMFNRLVLDFLSLSSGESPRQLQLKEEWKRRVR
jgi:pimeloyl-ACP methyl ester carboxylesterase